MKAKSASSPTQGCGALLTVVGLLGCGWFYFIAPNFSTTPSKPEKRLVTLRVRGTASSAEVRFTNSEGGTDTEKISNPKAGDFWERQLWFKVGDFVHLTAQSRDAGRREVRADIVDCDSSISRGEYAVASVSCRIR